MEGKKNKIKFPRFDRAVNNLKKIYTSQLEIVSVSDVNEVTFWDMNDGKIKLNITSGENSRVVKAKINFEMDTLILLTSDYTLAFYQNRKLIKTLNIANESTNAEIKHKLLFIEDIDEFRNIHLLKKEADKNLFLFDFSNFDLIEIKIPDMPKLESVKINRTNLIDASKLDTTSMIVQQDQLIIVHRELEAVLFIDKFVKTFSFISYKKRAEARSSETKKIAYLNYQDEKEANSFFRTFANFPNFKFKVWKIQNLEVFFSVSILKEENDDSNLSMKNVFSSLIAHARLVRSSNRNDKSIEVEIVQVYAFCQRFHFLEEFNTKNMILSAYHSKSVNANECEGNMFIVNVTKHRELFNVDSSVLSNAKVENICLDSHIEYLVFNDKNKLLWLFRVKDAKQLACLPLYGYVNQIKFNQDNSYVCLNMNDRRLFNLLIVDPDCDGHKKRIKQLNSRNVAPLNEKTKSKSKTNEEEIFEMFSSSDDSFEIEEILPSEEISDDKDETESKYYLNRQVCNSMFSLNFSSKSSEKPSEEN